MPLARVRQPANALKLLGLDESFSSRYINEGFSGGKARFMQLWVQTVQEKAH
jgi:Fe-S cluster assembly ATPase SufC